LVAPGWQRRTAQVAAVTMIAASLARPSAQHAEAADADPDRITAAGDLVVHGRGFGHGRGMSQYGAQGAALAGRTATQILDFYYPGTATTTVSGSMRIWLTADTTASLKVKPATGLKVRDLGDDAVFTLPVSSSVTRWAINPHGTNRTRISYFHAPQRRWINWVAGGRPVLRGMAQFEGSPVTFLILPDGSSRPYRGALRAADRSGSELDTLNVLGLDLYVRGVVPKEAITSWRPAALQAQAIAARTYSVSHRDRAVAAGKDYDLCDTVSCQVYGGYAAEVPSTNSAVAATAGRIRTHRGRPILAEFSSSNGGYTAPGPVPYQVGKADPYDGYPGNGNPNHSWTVTLDRATVQAGLGVGTLRRIRVDDRNGLGAWGGRVVTVTAVGSAGSKRLTGERMRFALGVRSAWFDPEQPSR
jgi:stage II sporulation protein D